MGIQSIDRAVEVLHLLARRSSAGVNEVAVELDVHKSTASRILSSLAEHGMTQKQPNSGDYVLGPTLLRLSRTVTARMDFSEVGQRLCDQVAQELGLTTNVAILDEIYAVNVCQAMGTGLLAPRHYVGLRTPGHATSSGKLLLAFDDDAATAAYSSAMERFTEATLTAEAPLRVELEQVRSQQWACSNEEWEHQITAVAVPLRVESACVEAALTVTGPSHRLPAEDFARVAEKLTRFAQRSGRWF